jgi:hypothetical protein
MEAHQTCGPQPRTSLKKLEKLPKLGGSARGRYFLEKTDLKAGMDLAEATHARAHARLARAVVNVARGPFLEHELLCFRGLHRCTIKDVAAPYSALIPCGTCLSQTIRNDGIHRRVKKPARCACL